VKVVHLATFGDGGGAARATQRWHRALLAAGVDSVVLCRELQVDRPRTFVSSSAVDHEKATKARTAQIVWIDAQRTDFSDVFFSQSFFDRTICNEPVVEAADIIHLHWTSRFLDPSELIKLRAQGKTIVATPHDLWYATGGCHYTNGCAQFRQLCAACPMVNEMSRQFVELNHRFKVEIFGKLVSAWICPSAWIKTELLSAEAFHSSQSCVVPYTCNFDQFFPLDKQASRQQLGLPTDRMLVLFIAENVTERRKGFADFQNIAKGLNDASASNMRDARKLAVVIAGKTEQLAEGEFGFPIFNLGFLESEEKLRAAYSAADLLLYTGTEDNFPNVIIEALACGTPVVAYRTGGVAEQIIPGINGELVDKGAIDDFMASLRRLAADQEKLLSLERNARDSVVSRFRSDLVAKRLIDAYQSISTANPEQRPAASVANHTAAFQRYGEQALVTRLTFTEGQVDVLRGEADWLRRELETTSARLGTAEARADWLHRELETTSARLGTAEARLGTATAELQTAAAELRTTAALIDAAYELLPAGAKEVSPSPTTTSQEMPEWRRNIWRVGEYLRKRKQWRRFLGPLA
jgi:glycosyltransferase involved in cell wall biosynthesis